jgi:hypothetical protein
MMGQIAIRSEIKTWDTLYFLFDSKYKPPVPEAKPIIPTHDVYGD